MYPTCVTNFFLRWSCTDVWYGTA